MKFLEHFVGESFSVDHLVYEVSLASSCSCFGCSLFIDSESECLDRDLRFGYCCGESRVDGNDVIFVQVGEDTD